jgi:Putative bacterial sensory transduction regulator
MINKTHNKPTLKSKFDRKFCLLRRAEDDSMMKHNFGREGRMRSVVKAIVVAVALVMSASANAQPRPGGGPGPGPGPGGPGPGGGGAPTGLVTKLTVAQMAQLMTAAGFQSKVIENNKTEMVQTIFWSQDVFSGAIPLACEKDGSGCHTYTIFANLGKASVAEKWINAWNANWPFVRAYLGNDGTLIFSWDVPLLTGATPQYVESAVQLFKLIVDKSTDFKG